MLRCLPVEAERDDNANDARENADITQNQRGNRESPTGFPSSLDLRQSDVPADYGWHRREERQNEGNDRQSVAMRIWMKRDG